MAAYFVTQPSTSKLSDNPACYSTFMSWLGLGDTSIDLCMTCSTISQTAQQRQL